MPRSKFASRRKIVFAKTPSGSSMDRNNSSVSCWVMFGHTEDCRLREILQSSGLPYMFYNDPEEPPVGTRYIELHVCFQLLSPSALQAEVDISASYVHLLGEPTGLKNIVLSGSRRPKVIHRSFGGEVTSTSHPPGTIPFAAGAASAAHRSLFPEPMALDESPIARPGKPCIITMKPLEFVVVVINVICPQDMVFETDFLSRALVLHIPMCLTKEIALRPRVESTSFNAKRPREMLPVELYHHYVNGGVLFGDCRLQEIVEMAQIERQNGHDGAQQVPAGADLKWIKVLQPGFLNASFLTEKDSMLHYMVLPGHCLALTSSLNSNFT